MAVFQNYQITESVDSELGLIEQIASDLSHKLDFQSLVTQNTHGVYREFPSIKTRSSINVLPINIHQYQKKTVA